MKATIRFTTKQGYTARPDITLTGGPDYVRKVAREALAIHDADAYTYSIQQGKEITHYSATSHKPLA